MNGVMLVRTHLAFGAFLALYFLPFVNYRFAFIVMVLIGTLIPDIDLMHSYVGKRWYFRPIQWFVKHRGAMHSITFGAIISIILALYFPILTFGFFLGYLGHLIGDAITIEGIRPLWPSKSESLGRMRVGGTGEIVLFYFLILIDVLMFVRLFMY